MQATTETDILILGMGAAGQLAAIYAHDANPDLNILIVTKALKGKGGCSRMVQGGFNVVLNDRDSHQKHLMDTLKGGQYINDQELAQTLVSDATATIKEMETRLGCFFDRNPDGTIHQKPFAGQCFDRTVHKGDLTGIEIISRTTEQVMKRRIPVLEEHRALELITNDSGDTVLGALLLDIKTGRFVTVRAKATLMATGGGPTQYRFHAPGPEKSVDGLGMLCRAGVVMRDMEMLQFHPTGLIVPGSVVAGSLLEEGLRGAGAYLKNGRGERFMQRYAPDVAERATRDVVSRSSFLEMMADRATPEGGVHMVASHLGPEFVEKSFPGMCQRCKQFKYDLARQPVPVSPTAHYLMGGAAIDRDCQSSLHRLFVAGEDSGGVHGANRLGGNGICDSSVFGRRAGRALARLVASDRGPLPDLSAKVVKDHTERFLAPLNRRRGENPFTVRDAIREMNWTNVGVVRNAGDLQAAIATFDELTAQSAKLSVPGGPIYNMPWNIGLDLINMLTVSKSVAESALVREESRGAHYRSDFTEQDDENGLYNTFWQLTAAGESQLSKRPVRFPLVSLKACQNFKK